MVALTVRQVARRWLWFGVGWLAVAVGAIGLVVPGLPTTVFFIVAAAAFSRSSPRFERWVLDLPRVGAMVRDHRAGLGMPRRAKAFAIGAILAASTLSVVLTVEQPWVAILVVWLAAVGVAYVGFRVPTREAVLAQRAARGPTRRG